MCYKGLLAAGKMCNRYSNHMFAYQGDVQGHLAARIQGMLNVCLSGELIDSCE